MVRWRLSYILPPSDFKSQPHVSGNKKVDPFPQDQPCSASSEKFRVTNCVLRRYIAMTRFAKIVYLILIILLVVLPFFITEPVLFFPESHAEALTILAILGLAYLVHIYDVRIKEKEKKSLERELETSIEKLNESFKYIGTVNRRLPLLRNLTTELLSKSSEKNKMVFEELLAIATSTISKSDWGMFRFIRMKDQNTEREFSYTQRNYILLKTKVGNKELIEMINGNDNLKKIGDLYVLSTTDRKEKVQCFLIFPEGENRIDQEYSILQSIVDQAQLFYKYLYWVA